MPEPKENNTPAIPQTTIPQKASRMQFVCPLCAGTSIYENNIVHVRLKVTEWNTDPEENCYGEPADFGYPWTEIDGTIRTVEPSEAPRWYCEDCGGEFDALQEIQLHGPILALEELCAACGKTPQTCICRPPEAGS
jgi:hypothetical protein